MCALALLAAGLGIACSNGQSNFGSAPQAPEANLSVPANSGQQAPAGNGDQRGPEPEPASSISNGTTEQPVEAVGSGPVMLDPVNEALAEVPLAEDPAAEDNPMPMPDDDSSSSVAAMIAANSAPENPMEALPEPPPMDPVSPTPEATPTPAPVAEATPAPTPVVIPSATPTPTPTPAPMPTPTPLPSSSPTPPPQTAVQACLAAWINKRLPEDLVSQYQEVHVEVQLSGQSNSQVVYSDTTVTADPKFLVVTLSGQNMNGSAAILGNPQGWYCIYFASKNANGFEFRKHPLANLEALSMEFQNANNYKVTNWSSAAP